MAKFIQFSWKSGALPLPIGSFYSQIPSGTWQPPMNAYRCNNSIRVCFDLAGVDKSQIDIQIEPGRLIVSGVRLPPEPSNEEPCTHKILALEIDHGPFLRELRLPEGVLRDEVTAEHTNGMLWINLPLRP